MPDSIRSRPLLKSLIVAAAFLIGILGIGALSDFVDADSTTANSSGTLTVAGETYSFTPTTCFVSEEDFVAAGPGYQGTTRYWVSASGVSLDLAFGTENEVDQPADSQVWLVSDELIDWDATNGGVVAKATMTDRRDPDSPTFLGTLSVRCSTKA